MSKLASKKSEETFLRFFYTLPLTLGIQIKTLES